MSRDSDYKDWRLQEQIKWYSQKARHNKLRFRTYQIIIIIAGSIIPVVNVGGFTDLSTRIISSIIGGIILVAIGITLLEKYHENWILYRITAESLKKEKYYFEVGAGEYSDLGIIEKDKLLVKRVESIVSSESF
jgi:Protein of unknown function (DUF4231)